MDMKKWFGLYRGNQGQPLLTKRVPMDDNSTAFVVHDVRLSRERNYSCRYEVEVLGRVLQSPQSDPIQILVVSIPVPTIMMTPSNGIVQNRNSLRIKCSASVSYPYTSMVFFLKKVPNNIDFQMTPTNNSFVIFTVANVNLTYAGNYTCGYQTFILDRTFTSLDSDLVQVVITDFVFWVIVIICCVGLAALVALLVLLAVIRYRKQKKETLEPKAKSEGSDGDKNIQLNTVNRIRGFSGRKWPWMPAEENRKQEQPKTEVPGGPKPKERQEPPQGHQKKTTTAGVDAVDSSAYNTQESSTKHLGVVFENIQMADA
ncbi:uncharacterized protein LOC106705200 [Latimeria chalumnae]|uniref:uncharacterized protein LOC106705200 n=1 Tax=Latimeria chalumnae TaxID=7897 RepID=UPI00313D286D